MPNCSSIDPLVTSYVDDELPGPDRRAVEQHLRACPPCQARVIAEQAVHALVRARKPDLQRERAPASLRARCAAGQSAAGRDTVGIRSRWRPLAAPLALAAVLVLLVGGALVYRMTQLSTRVMAAELAADHLKCFMVNAMLRTNQGAATVERALASSFGWEAHLPEQPDSAGLELVGARPCLYGEGRVAHIMYRHHGRPVSVFMLPRKKRPEEVVGVVGHEAAIWSRGDRTFVLIAREPRAEVQRLAKFVQDRLR